MLSDLRCHATAFGEVAVPVAMPAIAATRLALQNFSGARATSTASTDTGAHHSPRPIARTCTQAMPTNRFTQDGLGFRMPRHLNPQAYVKFGQESHVTPPGPIMVQ